MPRCDELCSELAQAGRSRRSFWRQVDVVGWQGSRAEAQEDLVWRAQKKICAAKRLSVDAANKSVDQGNLRMTKRKSRPFGRLSSGIQVEFEAFISGGADQDRTDDLLNAIQALSQLSYSPTTRRRLLPKADEKGKRFFQCLSPSSMRTNRGSWALPLSRGMDKTGWTVPKSDRSRRNRLMPNPFGTVGR